jgi:hypothetical protein
MDVAPSMAGMNTGMSSHISNNVKKTSQIHNMPLFKMPRNPCAESIERQM